MKNIINLLFLFGLILVTACESQPINTGTIHGVVTDYATGEPIKTASVTLMPIGYTTITGSEGQFQFDNLEPRTYQLMIQKTGYEILTTTNLQLSLGAIIPQNLQMTVMPPSLKVLDDKGNAIDTLFFDATLADDNIRLFNILNDGVEDLNWEVLSNSRWIKSIHPQSGVLKTTETVGIVVEIDRSLITNTAGEESTIHVVTDNGGKEIKLSLGNEYEKYKEYLKQIEEYNTLSKIKSCGIVYSVLPEEYTSQSVDWYTAMDLCNSITYAGYDDWFLPNVDQVFKIAETLSTKMRAKWSSNESESSFNEAYLISDDIFECIEARTWPKVSTLSFYCIRKEKDVSSEEYNNIQTININNRKYMVLPHDYTQIKRNWEDAIKECESISYAGYDDWYLPSKKELKAMREKKDIIGGFYPTNYWSSTEETSQSAWHQSFSGTTLSNTTKSKEYKVRCVRKE